MKFKHLNLVCEAFSLVTSAIALPIVVSAGARPVLEAHGLYPANEGVLSTLEG